jgi:PAS domain S-box-containing protein
MSESEHSHQSNDPEDRPLQERRDGPVPGIPNLTSMPPDDIPKLVEQLHVQHVQLEMQNEELRQSQEALTEACDHYTQLYDFSPSGYVTIKPDGILEEANLRFCAMVGVNRKLVLNRPFIDFVVPQDWELFRRHCADVLEVGTTQTCKLRLLPKTGLPLVMHMESMPVKNPVKPAGRIQSAMLDITMMERAERVIRENQLQMQHTAAKLMTAQDEERRRIARELHDDYCQRLAALILEVGLLPRRHPGAWTNPVRQLQPIKAALSTLLADLRDLSHDLHPGQTTSVALDQALRTYLSDFKETTRIETTFESDPRPLHVPASVSTCLYRITQEGLTNIRKHAKATRVSVSINNRPRGLELVIKDDGRGFEPDTVAGTHHLGLTSMRERVEQLDGTLTITSKPAGGTTLSIHVPLPGHEQSAAL